MKNTIPLTLALIFTLFSQALHAQEPKVPSTSLLAGMNGNFEMVDGDVLKVYSMEDQGAIFCAYVVKYKDEEVIVSDVLHTTPEKKEGDKVTFMVQHMEIPKGTEKIKIIQFIRVK
jgi:hypothetical protein